MEAPDNPYAPPSSDVDGAALQVSAQDRIEVTYSRSYFDIVWDRISLFWRRPMFALAYCVIVFWYSYLQASDDVGNVFLAPFLETAATVFAGILVSASVFSVISIALSARRGSRDLLFGPFRMELSQDGVTRETSTERTLIKWRGIRAVFMGRRYIRVHQTPERYFLLPRSAFVVESDAQRFYLTAKRYLDQVRRND